MNSKKYNCDVCEKSYVRKKCLENHKKKKHETIMNQYSSTREINIDRKKAKQKIAAKMRLKVWETHVGNKLVTKCFCCLVSDITPFTNYQTFQCGHILSERNGGKIKVENLLPICKKCNISMGSSHWDSFIRKKKLRVRLYGCGLPEATIRTVKTIQRWWKELKKKKKKKKKVKRYESLTISFVNKNKGKHMPCKRKIWRK